MAARRGVQIHLGTAIVMMFAAAGIVCANVGFRIYPDGFKSLIATYGWPFEALRAYNIREHNGSRWNPVVTHFAGWDVSYLGILGDVLLAASALFMVWYLCEVWIEFREVQKLLRQR